MAKRTLSNDAQLLLQMRDTPDIVAAKRHIVRHLRQVYTDNSKTKALRLERSLRFVYETKEQAENFIKANACHFQDETASKFIDEIVDAALILLAEEGQPRAIKKPHSQP